MRRKHRRLFETENVLCKKLKDVAIAYKIQILFRKKESANFQLDKELTDLEKKANVNT